MTQRIIVAELPDFDAAPYLDCPQAIAACLGDIHATGNASLVASALDDITRARSLVIGQPPK